MKCCELSGNSFPSWTSEAKDTCQQFQRRNIEIVNENELIFVSFSATQILILAQFKDMLKIRDRAPLPYIVKSSTSLQ